MPTQARIHLSRRGLMTVAAMALLSVSRPGAAQNVTNPTDISFAYRYALPVFEIARLRYHLVYDSANPHRVPVNTLVHSRNLADHTSRWVTTPNNDTLYSSASLDLARGPVRIDVPDFGARYYSIALMDMFTNNFAYIGSRATGSRPGSFLVAGPNWHGKAATGAKLIRSPTNVVQLLVRILVDGPDDLSAVHGLQDAIRLTSLADHPTPPPPIAPVQDDALNFVAVVNQALGANPPPPADKAVLPRLARVGVAPGAAGLSQALATAWQADFAGAQKSLRDDVRSARRQVVSGWGYSAADTGNFGTHYDDRAAVALAGLLALTREEAIYLGAVTDSSGQKLDGAHHYRLHVPKDLPLDGFWSLSMYEVVPDGRAFFTDNKLHRYAIGDRTRGLQRKPDGSLDIIIQRDSPGPELASNWLPMPASGPFRMTLRAYLPRAELLDGRFRFAALERID